MAISLTIVFAFFLAPAALAFRDFKLRDRLLANKNFHSFSARDWLQCVVACHYEDRCISFNYDTSSFNLCQLNDCGFHDRCEASRSLLVSPGAIFEQLRPAGNDAVCVSQTSDPEIASKHSVLVECLSDEHNISLVKEPVNCSYDKDDSQENVLWRVKICGRTAGVLRKCSSKNPIRLISVRYSNCTCECESCEKVPLPEACLLPGEFDLISKKCEGKKKCKLSNIEGPCDSSRRMAVYITYSCSALIRNVNSNDSSNDSAEEDGSDDNENDDDDDDDEDEEEEENHRHNHYHRHHHDDDDADDDDEDIN